MVRVHLRYGGRGRLAAQGRGKTDLRDFVLFGRIVRGRWQARYDVEIGRAQTSGRALCVVGLCIERQDVHQVVGGVT